MNGFMIQTDPLPISQLYNWLIVYLRFMFPELLKSTICFTRFESPLGTFISCATPKGICLLEFSDRKMLQTELKLIRKKFNTEIEEGESEYFDLVKLQLDEYFNKKRKEFTVPLHMIGTPFQQKAWNELLKIPYGQTRSYKAQALALNSPLAVRAVANANGMNMIAIVIPCHRVIGEDGSLTGYGGGLWRKKWLLELESNQLRF